MKKVLDKTIKKNIILILFIVVLIFFFYLILYGIRIKPAILSNVTELYSLFTPTMESFVNLHLEPITCQKNEYYYNNSSFCFICGKFDTCFGFSYVIRERGKTEMNPTSTIYLNGEYDNLTALNFYSSGLDRFLNCKENLECENGIKAKIENNIVTNLRITYNGSTTTVNNALNGTFAVFRFPSTYSVNDINSEIMKLANNLGYGNETCKYFLDYIRYCDKLIIIWVDNNAVVFLRD
jgi:hypothetical protein